MKSATLSRPNSSQLAHERAIAAYDQRESEYPVLAGLYRFSARGAGGERQGFLREDLVEWAKRRFDAELSVDDLKNKQREEIRELLVAHSQKNNEQANQVAAEAQERVEQLFAGERSAAATLGAVTGQNGKLDDLTTWLKTTCNAEITSDELARLDREEASRKVSQVVEDHFRPEMRRMERALLLQILDSAWKEHLLAMDHLKSSVGLRGYAQIDPKVEYKREGMALFDTLWISIGNYVTDLIFKMEQLDEGFVGSTWVEVDSDQGRSPPGERDRTATAGRDRRHAKPTRSSSRSATWARRSAATTPAPAAAGKNTNSAACGSKTIHHGDTESREGYML